MFISSLGKGTFNLKRWRRSHWQLCETSVNEKGFRSVAHFNVRYFALRWNLSELSWIFQKNLGETSLPIIIGFLCLSQIISRASFIERHRTNCCECYWLHSNEGHNQTAVCIQYQTLSNRRFVHSFTVDIGHGPPKIRGFSFSKTTLYRNTRDERSARRRDLYLYNPQS